MNWSGFKVLPMMGPEVWIQTARLIMGRDKLRECWLFVVRYVPDVVRGECVNVGMFLHCPSQDYLGCRFTRDFRRIKRFHPAADLEFLRELQQHFEREVEAHTRDLAGYLRRMQDSYSNMIQVTTPKRCRLRDPQREIEDLFARYVGPHTERPSHDRRRLRDRLR